MSNLPVATASTALAYAQPGALALPANVMDDLSRLYEESFTGMGGGNLRRIKIRRADFLAMDGSNEEAIPADRLIGVFVGAAKQNHAVWYRKSYAPGMEPEIPDLVWNMPTADTFPDALPPEFHKKIMRDGQERWGFQICRRVALALLRADAHGAPFLDLERPYVMDLSSMSLFGKGMPEQNKYKWSGIKDVCSQQSTISQVKVTPFMFLMKVVIDMSTPVTGVALFEPERNPQSGQLQLLDANLVGQIYNVANAQSTHDMLTVREKLSYDGAAPTNVGMIPQTQQPLIATPPPGQVLADPSIFNLDAGFNVPIQTPEQQVQNPPSTPVQAPVLVAQQPVTAPQPSFASVQPPSAMPQQVTITPPAPGVPDMSSLLMQASAVIDQGPPAAAQIPVQQPTGVPVMPQAGNHTDATVNALRNALG